MNKNENTSNLQQSIYSLEKRIARIEKLLSVQNKVEVNKDESKEEVEKSYDSESMELHFGKVWLAKVGIIILLIGFLFLITSSFKGLPQVIPVVIGYFISVLLLIFIKLDKKWLKNLNNYLLSSFYLLVYFSTLRLAYFSENPLIENSFLEICLLASVSLVFIFISYKKESQSLFGISFLIAFISSLVVNQTYFSLFLIVFFTSLLAMFVIKLNSKPLIVVGIILTYVSHSIWLIKYLSSTISELYLYIPLVYFLIYAYCIAINSGESEKDVSPIISTFLNSMFSTILIVFSAYKNNPENIHVCCFVGFLIFISTAVVYWKKNKANYSTYFIAIAGYLLLSVAIISYFPKPDFFIWLSWQSLVVVSTAILFKSRFIIVANFFIYVGTLLAYLILAGKVSSISISFGLVALLSARILNWQKERLSLNSGLIRIAYLFCAFFIFPYSLYNWLPQKYIIFSWVGLSIIYLILSVILKNNKYRLMALLTLLMTVIYLILFGITGLAEELRIITFIILGIILLVVSIYYTRLKGKVIKE